MFVFFLHGKYSFKASFSVEKFVKFTAVNSIALFLLTASVISIHQSTAVDIRIIHPIMAVTIQVIAILLLIYLRWNKVMIRACPLCGEHEAKVERVPELVPTEDNVREGWSGFLKEKIFFPFSRCSCGFLYCREYLDNAKLASLYSSMGDNEHSGNSFLEQKTKAAYARQFLAGVDNDTFENVLEVGADNGTLASELMDICDIRTYHCVEPNIEMHPILKQMPNVRVYESLEQAISTGVKFDAAIAVHVLDHVPDITDFLNQIVQSMKLGAYLYAVVHNEDSLLAKVFGRRWPAYCLQHPHLFNRDTLAEIYLASGVVDTKVSRTVNYFNISYLFEHLLLATLNGAFATEIWGCWD